MFWGETQWKLEQGGFWNLTIEQTDEEQSFKNLFDRKMFPLVQIFAGWISSPSLL